MNYADLLLPEPGEYVSEEQYADWVLGQLAPAFHICREVPGRYPTGESVRLDAVLRPRDPGSWFDDEPVFGVEFKRPVTGHAERDEAGQIRQAADYGYCEFTGYGRLGIFLCPSPAVAWLRDARDVCARFADRAAEENTIQYHLRWAELMRRGTGRPFAAAELEAEARTLRWKAKKRREVIETGARAEGFRGAAHREQRRLLDQAGFMVRMLGAFGVGELMQHRELGWTLLRSGERLWSQLGEPVRRPTSLRPRIGSRQRIRPQGSVADHGK